MWSSDPSINPYGISFRALEPGNTPDLVFQALVPNSVLKLSFGVGLIGTYLGGSTQGRIAPVVDKWIAAAAADAPQLYGSGDLCDRSTHDTATSTMQQDLAWRSVGCQPERLGLPWLWAQAFDDGLFTPDMAISMWRRAPNRAQHRLYLSMGGHAAPAADQSVEQDKLDTQRRFLDAVMQGRALPRPNVVYWTRDPTVEVPADSYAYPAGAWRRQTADSWPPAKIADATYRLGADGSATQGSASSGVTYLSPLTEDERNDPVAAAALSGTPLGTSPLSSVPATNLPGFIASFRTPAVLHGQGAERRAVRESELDARGHRLAAGARAVRRGALREAHAVQPRRSGTPRRPARSRAAGARRRQRVQHPDPGGPPGARLGDGREPGLLQALSQLGGRPPADGRRLDARAAAALLPGTLRTVPRPLPASTHGVRGQSP